MNSEPTISLVDEILDTIKIHVENCEDAHLQHYCSSETVNELENLYGELTDLISYRRKQFKEIKDKENLTLTEAILHARHVQEDSDLCEKCRAEHGRLADWLQELKNFRRVAESVDTLKEV